MPPPTREEVNALIERRKPLGFFTVPDCLEAVAALTALQAENDRLRAQASPTWVALSERKPTREDASHNDHVLQFCPSVTGHPWIQSAHWSDLRFCTHWMRLPAPPESAADRQRREDEEAYARASKEWDDGKVPFSASPKMNFMWHAALAHARKEATP